MSEIGTEHDKLTFINYQNYDNGGLFDHHEEFEFTQNRTHFILGLFQDIGLIRILLGTDFTFNETGDMKFIGRSEWTNSFFLQAEILL